MASRYHVDLAQAQRVAETAATLLRHCRDEWRLGSELAANVLRWASTLHEIGLDISHSGFQRHGAYIAGNANMPGFPRAEQRVLAFLIANQRREIALRDRHELPRAWHRSALRLAILLRLAVLLNRSRTRSALPEIEIAVTERSLQLKFPGEWLAANPLTVADLEREQSYLAQVGYTLSTPCQARSRQPA